MRSGGSQGQLLSSLANSNTAYKAQQGAKVISPHCYTEGSCVGYSLLPSEDSEVIPPLGISQNLRLVVLTLLWYEDCGCLVAAGWGQ